MTQFLVTALEQGGPILLVCSICFCVTYSLVILVWTAKVYFAPCRFVTGHFLPSNVPTQIKQLLDDPNQSLDNLSLGIHDLLVTIKWQRYLKTDAQRPHSKHTPNAYPRSLKPSKLSRFAIIATNPVNVAAIAASIHPDANASARSLSKSEEDSSTHRAATAPPTATKKIDATDG